MSLRSPLFLIDDPCLIGVRGLKFYLLNPFCQTPISLRIIGLMNPECDVRYIGKGRMIGPLLLPSVKFTWVCLPITN